MLVLYGLLALIALNGLFYGAAVFIFYLGFKFFRKKSYIYSVIFFVISTYPLVIYVVYGKIVAAEQPARIAEIASWPRVAIPEDREITSLNVRPYSSGTGIPAELKHLISTGALDSIVSEVERRPDEVPTVYRARHDSDCVKNLRSGSLAFDLRSAAMARNAFHLCHTVKKGRGGPDSPIRLYLDGAAPSGNKKCGGATRELRWAPELGGELIAFEEVGYFRSIEDPVIIPDTFYPVLCKYPNNYASVKEDQERLNAFGFVARALGRTSVHDYPRIASQAEALEAIRILNEENTYAAPKGITLLLGQWPSNPEISRYIKSSLRNGSVFYKIFNNIHGKNAERLFPHLRSHAEDLLEVCHLATSYAGHCNSWELALQ